MEIPSFSPEEGNIIAKLIPRDAQFLGAEAAVDACEPARLPPEVLARIWDIADEGAKGHLTLNEVGVAARLIGWAQRGFAVQANLVHRPGPLAILHNKLDLTAASETVSSTHLPTLSSEDKARHKIIFNDSGPENGILDGVKVWDIILKSRLPMDTLTKIWDLVDVRRCGALNVTEFNLVMYLIHGLLVHRFAVVPASLPSHIRTQAEPDQEYAVPSPQSGAASVTATHADAFQGKLNLRNAFTGDFHFIRASANLEAWHLPDVVRKHSNFYFDALNQQSKEFIEGDQAVSFLLLSKLPSTDLEHIWNLIDSTSKGHLTRDDFALVMFLVYKQLAGVEIPRTLPSSSRISSIVSPLASPIPTLTRPNVKRSPLASPEEKPLIPRDSLNETESLQQQLTSLTQLRLTERSTLRSQIHELQVFKDDLLTENSELRLSLRTMDDSLKRSVSYYGDRANASDTENTNLKKEIRLMENTISQLTASHQSAMEDLTHANQFLHTEVDRLSDQLEVTNTEQAVQKMVNEELSDELDRLRVQIREFRDSTTLLPLSGGDEELQTLINEDLAKENSTLRGQVQELGETLRELQTANANSVSREQMDEVSRLNRRLTRRIRQSETQDGELQRELERLRADNHRLSVVRVTTEEAPPAYDDI
ncbi:uncharacterized protein BT62DRAFT_1002483 [Guyanagaster necrorhizus]|uniref:EH domain-containing and endocytosis protein 1 n=1 Tax=Guyanagaster necrorhizus TaxID=856835 RepID=A0A9P8AUX9_9AGAR|nr:uncharacterized protein BT62DRAFT_1002483 [Guyanagaster necrorhizus MCA 3950]KAG7448938.1 hypothetical protein BT62DRAFT_1002483 [Guyanagaster necrorhizus MCA 3950]